MEIGKGHSVGKCPPELRPASSQSPINNDDQQRTPVRYRRGGRGAAAVQPPNSSSSSSSSRSSPLTTRISPVRGGGTGSRGSTGTGSRVVRRSTHFRLSRLRHLLRAHSRAQAIAPVAVLVLATFLEHVLNRLFFFAGRHSANHRRYTLRNRHLQLAIQSTRWLADLLPTRSSTIPGAGFVPHYVVKREKVAGGGKRAQGKGKSQKAQKSRPRRRRPRAKVQRWVVEKNPERFLEQRESTWDLR
ncbi:hypothetical protein TYRP_003998 [Tyrophagus putrescentiae]|nr:hypothetical protein TYRP_003998 [Tyrophagus putrescentiae]